MDRNMNIPAQTIVGIDQDAIDTIVRPMTMDLMRMKRLPYGSTPSSFYKRVMFADFNNSIGGTVYSNIALIYTPMNAFCSVIPLSSSFTPTLPTALADGAITATQAATT